MILLLLFIPFVSFASINGEVGAYSDFIWRGTTFTNHKPAVQMELDAEEKHGFYVGSFFSNAEFDDPALHEHAEVTSEVDVTVGKRWEGEHWGVQFYYSRFFFPNAGVFDTDEWNLSGSFKRWTLELSLMDDYFGYQSRYTYIRVGKEWTYKQGLDGALYLGYNAFDRPQGAVKTRATFETLNGAGNNDYVDLWFVHRKTLANESFAELALNWTNRDEYVIDSGVVTKQNARDFVFVISYVVPFTL